MTEIGRPTPAIPRRATSIRTVGAALGLLAAGAAVSLGGVASGDRADPDVRLPEAGEVPPEPALSSDDAAMLRRQVSEDRLHCEPRGCELWRRDRADVWGVVALDDAVVLLEPGRLVSLDGTTGQLRWMAAVDDAFPEGRGSAPLGATPHQHLFATGDAVVVAGDGRVVLVDGGGERQWSAPAPTDAFRHGEVVDGLVVLEGWGGGGRAGSEGLLPLLVLDAANGRVLIDDWVTEVLHVDGPYVVARRFENLEVLDARAGGRPRWQRALWRYGDDEVVETLAELAHAGRGRVSLLVPGDPAHLEVLDLSTGELEWRRPLPDGGEPAAGDRWIGVADRGGQVLIDVADGREITTLDGVLSHAFVAVGDRAVAVLTGDGTAASDATLVALDDHGEVAWQIPLPARANWHCCAWLRTAGEIVTAGADDERVRVDAATGEELERWWDPRHDGTGFFLRRWYAADGTRVQETTGGLVLDGVAGQARIRPPGASVETGGPWVVSHGRQLLGFRLLPAG